MPDQVFLLNQATWWLPHIHKKLRHLLHIKIATQPQKLSGSLSAKTASQPVVLLASGPGEIASQTKGIATQTKSIASQPPLLLATASEEIASPPEDLEASAAQEINGSQTVVTTDEPAEPPEQTEPAEETEPVSEDNSDDEKGFVSGEIVTEGPSDKGITESGDSGGEISFGEKHGFEDDPSGPLNRKDFAILKKSRLEDIGAVLATSTVVIASEGKVLEHVRYFWPTRTSELNTKYDRVRAMNLLSLYANKPYIDQVMDDNSCIAVYSGNRWALQIKKDLAEKNPKYRYKIFNFIDLAEDTPTKKPSP